MVTAKAQATKERILAAASRLFYAGGYHATGLDKVIREAGVTKGNFYYHFSSKEELAVATLEWQFEQLSEDVAAVVSDKGKTPLQRFLGLLRYMARRQKEQHDAGHIQGCYFGNFSLEMSASSAASRARLSDIFRRYQALFTLLLKQAIAAGEISSRHDPAALAAVFLGQIEGAILLDKAQQKPQYFDASIAFIEQYLKKAG